MVKLDNLQDLGSVLEPYDPNYLSNKEYEIPQLSKGEQQFYRKMNIVINKLRRNNISFEWLEREELFRVKKFRYTEVGAVRRKDGSLLCPTRVYSEYPTYMYIVIYDKEYAFGGEETDLIVSTRISEVIEEVKEWLNNNEPAVK